jgi:hypothetical protein
MKASSIDAFSGRGGLRRVTGAAPVATLPLPISPSGRLSLKIAMIFALSRR